MAEVFIGRQPIFDKNTEVIGYELLYRSANVNKAEFLDGNQATATVISNAFLEIGLDRLVGNKLAFINLTRDFVMGDLPLPLQKNQLVLEILEDIVLDDALVKSLKRLSESGYKLAMDDVIDPNAITSALKIADIIKVDLMSVKRDQLPFQVDVYKRNGLKILAEKVETQDEYRWCIDLGFDYFQGYFLCKPNIVKEKKLSGSKLNIMRLLALLQQSTAEFTEIENIIQQDVSLSYKLLRLINSAYYRRGSEIKSIKQALTLLGLKQIKSWTSLILVSESEDKPIELMVTAMIRGKMCELFAQKVKTMKSEVNFTVGLFSVLDALLDMSFEDILAQVPLAIDIQEALTKHKGVLGEMLLCVLAYEQGDWDNVKFGNLDATDINKFYLSAVEWAEEVKTIITAGK